MYYYGHLGFHSVLYLKSNGSWTGSELGTKASHGCIRQSLDDARWAYYWTPDGTEADMIQEHFNPPPPKPKPAQGGGDAAGVVQASTTWYFAEGCTASGFDEFLLLMNPQAAQADATVRFTASDGTRKDVGLTIPGYSRQTIRANSVVPDKQALCAAVASDRPIVAERSMYFEYGKGELGGDTTSGCTSPAREWYFAEGTCRPGFDSYLCLQNPGAWDGGDNVVGITAPAHTFYFAEGSCRPGFDPYLCIFNPGAGAARVDFTFMLGNGKQVSSAVDVRARSRFTVRVKDYLGEGDDSAHDFSCRVRSVSTSGIVVERPVYFSYRRY